MPSSEAAQDALVRFVSPRGESCGENGGDIPTVEWDMGKDVDRVGLENMRVVGGVVRDFGLNASSPNFPD